MRCFIGVRNLLIATLLVLVLSVVCFAENDYIETEDVSETVAKKVLDLDNMVMQFRPDTGEVTIRGIKKSLDAEGNEVSRRAGKSFNYKNAVDIVDTDEDETSTRFSDFLAKLFPNLTQDDLEARVKQAVREMEAE